MKAIKIIVTLLLVYVGMVATFESLLGYFQPEAQTTLVITTTDANGTAKDRVLARIESGGQLYVATNHWPRAWYKQALQNPRVEIAAEGISGKYSAVPISGAEYERVNSDHSLGTGFRILTGFPPRYILRLEPRAE